MRFDLVTLFPEIFGPFCSEGFVGRAVGISAAKFRIKNPRDFGRGSHRSVDDTPYGGGSGMVLRADVMLECIDWLDSSLDETEPKARRVLLTPQGNMWNQVAAERLSREPAVMWICGRYEGFDERIRDYVDEEVSLGDFVMTGGEIAAMAAIDSIVRLLPGVLGNAHSIEQESHSSKHLKLLEYPQYTRPAVFRGASVPSVLCSGNHQKIEAYRLSESLLRTQRRRPDLYTRALSELFAQMLAQGVEEPE